ncbi:MAG: hypothetical protein Q4E37_06695 [Tissierellia bacterium]|nr:hypothetical protein [Tissierellia bacterium]
MLNQIIESMEGNTEFIAILLIASVVAIVVTFVINLTTKSFKFAKYIPGLLLVLAGVVTLITVLDSIFLRESLSQLFFCLVTITAGLCSLLTALAIGIYNKDRYGKPRVKDQRV